MLWGVAPILLQLWSRRGVAEGRMVRASASDSGQLCEQPSDVGVSAVLTLIPVAVTLTVYYLRRSASHCALSCAGPGATTQEISLGVSAARTRDITDTLNAAKGWRGTPAGTTLQSPRRAAPAPTWPLTEPPLMTAARSRLRGDAGCAPNPRGSCGLAQGCAAPRCPPPHAPRAERLPAVRCSWARAPAYRSLPVCANGRHGPTSAIAIPKRPCNTPAPALAAGRFARRAARSASARPASSAWLHACIGARGARLHRFGEPRALSVPAERHGRTAQYGRASGTASGAISRRLPGQPVAVAQSTWRQRVQRAASRALARFARRSGTA